MTYNIANKNSDILGLLLEAKEQGITVFLEDNRVRLKVKEGVELTEDFLKQLKEEKERILQFLQSEAGQFQETATSYIKNEIKPYDKNSTAKIPLSYAQERLWFIDKLQGSLAYHIPGVMRIKGTLEIQLLNEAFKALINRHESLRTVFRDEDGIGYQFIKQSDDFPLNYISEIPENTSVETIIDNTTSKAFDLSNDYMLRATIVKETEESHVLIIVLHHIASDGWSLPIVISELEAFYQNLRNKTKVELPPLPIQYADYSIWQRNYLSGKVLEDKLAYWKEKLQNAAVLELPTDYLRPSVKSTEGALHRFEIDKETTQKLHALTKEHGATLFMTLVSAYKILLYKYTQQTDISIGTPIANREQEEIRGLVGFFINTIVLRDELNIEADFDTLLQQVKQTCLAAYTHQDVPFERIVDHLAVERDQSRSPLFQTMFVLQNTEEVGEMSLGESAIEAVNTEHTTAQFDLMFSVKERSESIGIHVEYATKLFKAETIARLAMHFEQLLKSIVQHPKMAINALPMLLETEKTQLLKDFNNTSVEYSKDQTVVSLFAEQVKAQPEATALIFEGNELTYKELDERSNQVANYLLSKGITANSLVPICIERSLEMHIGILGILKAGGAYVPIDTNNPVERIEFIVNDINADIILTSSALAETFKTIEKEVCELDALPENLSKEAVSVKVESSHLAYAIYTSGTTGLPKGVKNAHSGLLNRLFWMQEDVNITNESVLIQKTPYVFDVSVWELLMPLISGCTLVIAKPDGHKDPLYLQETIEQHKVNLIHFVPSMLAVFLEVTDAEKCNSLENIVCSGEALPVQMVKDFKAKFQNTGIRNYYGPTEAAIDVTAIDLTNEDYEVTIPIGKPVANTNIYIVDANMNLCPIGVSGELLIGGVQVSEGYINREELNKEKFIASPFNESECIYKTGDIAKWLPDGNIAYVGRKDDQIKLRGYRIELGEIIAAIDQIEEIKQSLVVVREDKGSKQLVAYVVSESEIDSNKIQEILATQLPEYMIPRLYMQLESFPLTTNGKVDRKALPAPADADYQTTEYVAPRTETEQEVARIWQAQLEIERIGIHDNFFELGGDSIKIIRLISVINKKYETNIAIASFYQTPTVESLVKLIESENQDDQEATYLAIEQELEATALSVRNNHPYQEAIENVYPMSDIQVGMVLTSEMMRLDGELGIYHDQMVSQIGSVDIALMEKALKLLVQKHEILRTSFHLYDYIKPVQIVHKEIPVTIGKHTISAETSEAQETYITNFLEKEREENNFEVTKAPLWRVDFFELGTSDAFFVFQFHHAIMDGWSDKSFRAELMETYFALQANQNFKPTSLAIGIKESVISDLLEVRNEDNINYWQKTLQDYKRLDILSDERFYRQTHKVYESEFLKAILAKCKADQIAPKNLFFAGYLYVLSLFSLEKDITIGTVANRRPIAEDGDKLLGCFLNTVPFRHTVETKNQTWESYVKTVVKAQQGLQGKDRFSLLEIAKMHQESAEGNPFFDVLFNYVDFYVVDSLLESEAFESHIASAEKDNLAVSGFERTNTFLDFTANLTNQQLLISTNQSKRFKSGHTVDDLLEYFDNFLHKYVEQPTALVDSSQIIPKSEQKEVLEIFNDTEVAYDESVSIVDIFTKQVQKTPKAPAVVFQNTTLTYEELDAKSNQFARYLQKKGITPGSLVPICMERSAELVIGILAILKTGSAYVPIDPAYPKARIEFMVNDTKAKFIITQKSLAQLFSGTKTTTEKIYIDTIQAIENESKTAVETQIAATDLAYIIYTSGTTGTPKGVMISHANLHNLASWHQRAYELTENSKALLFSGISFDASVWELFPYILSGGCVYPVAEEIRLDIAQLINFIRQNEITHAYLPTSLYASIQQAEIPLNGLKLLLGGEALKMNELPTDAIIYNNYGPTENTVVATYHKVETLSKNIPIGKPVDNTQAYILDANLQLVPKGVFGELCLSGKSLSKGYLYRDELTLEKFIAHPFKANERLYRTGDIVRWNEDGNLEFGGRQDHQVKIRGYRVELGEIEASLDQLDEITQSVVLAKKDASGNNQLVAYITSETAIDTKTIQSKLAAELPSYMIPKLCMQLEAFPLTANGKIDRNQLPEPDESAYQTTIYVAPETEEETKLVTIWQELLNIETIGIHDDFFELGGHSLLAIRLASYIKATFGVVISVRDIFTAPTIQNLAKAIQNANLSTIPSITISERPAQIPLSYAQERLWFIDQLQGSEAYHIPSVIRIEKGLDKAAFSQAMQLLVARHEALRTIFKEENGHVYQEIITSDNFKVNYVEALPTETSLENFVAHECARPFNLATDYLVRVTVIQNDDQSQTLVFVMHHIASDGWSIPLFVKELETIYQAKLTKTQINLPELPVQYADYSIWQRNYLSGETLANKLQFWREKLQNAPYAEFPADFTRPELQSMVGKVYSFKISKETTAALREISKANGVTSFMTLLAIYKILTYKYTGQTDISIGTPIANREQEEIANLIGIFVNTIVLRNELKKEASFTELLQQIKENCLEAYNHQDVPFEQIVDDLVEDRDQSRTPLFQTLFVLQNNEEIEEFNLGESAATTVQREHTTAKFDLTFTLTETSEGIFTSVEYVTALFKEETIARMAEHFENIAKSIVANATQTISEIEMLDVAEKQTLLVDLNQTATNYPKDKNAVLLFEAQAKQNPNNIAVTFEGESLSYHELNERANQFANYLLENSIEKGDQVVFFMNRGIDYLIGMLGVWKVGACFIPLSTDFPLERNQQIISQSNSGIVISTFDLKENVKGLTDGEKILFVNASGDASYGTNNLSISLAANDVSYIIFTSGSTGKPKGAMVAHLGMLNHLYAKINDFNIDENSNIAQTATQVFDVSIWQYMVALMVGGTTTVLVGDDAWDPKQLLSHIKNQGITVFESVPAHFSILLDYIEAQAEKPSLSKLEMLMMNGEGLPPAYCERWFKLYPEIAMSNVYGPTECSDDITHYIFNKVSESWDGYVPIGKPIQNMEMYIVDEDIQLVPKGIIGELCTSGDGVGQGYLGRVDLTNEKFIKNPFKENTKLYRTGDLVKWLADGTIEFIGRKDSQVKISGNRIELGEIEVVLQEAPQVKLGAVLVKEDNTNKRLVGYIKTNESYTKEALQEYLEARLPAHMIPTLFIEMDNMPLTPSGKIDRKALPEPTFGEESQETYTAPNTATEKQLVTIWEELLNVSPIGIHDNFFKLGGHSLLGIRLVSNIKSQLEVSVSIRDVFANPTVATFAKLISEGNSTEVPKIIKATRPERIPLSYTQERLWFLDKLQGTIAYHNPGVVRIEKALDKTIFSNAVKALVERHESLRTVFKEDKGIGYQEIIKSDDFEVKYISEFPQNSSIDVIVQNEILRPFDLSSDYMLRVSMVADADNSHVLILVIHHIASDGWSTPILIKELETIYEALLAGNAHKLPELPVQYADYSIWQRNYLSGEILEEKLAYWRSKLANTTPQELPTDYPRPSVQSTDGQMYNFSLDNTTLTALNELSQANGATLYMTLLSIYKVLLYRYTGQIDISVGTPIANREQEEIEGLIGFFANTIVLRDEIDTTTNFTTLLAQVKETCLAAYEHQDVPFEQIVDDLALERDQSKTPLFQTLFILQNNEEVEEFTLGESAATTVRTKHTTAKFDLTFNFTETPNGLLLDIEYVTALFKEETIIRMAKHFETIAKSIVSNTSQTISKIEMLDVVEKENLLINLNQTATNYPKDKNAVLLFEAQAKQNPNNIAVTFEGKSLTYHELNERANQFANYLLENSIQKGDQVVFFMNRGIDYLIGMLGVWKVGACFIPLSTDFPLERNQQIISQSNSGIVISTFDLKENVKGLADEEKILFINASADASYGTNNLNIQLLANDVSYIIFTSGSTGKPKGAMVEHQGMLNHLYAKINDFNIDENSNIAQTATQVFDVSIWQYMVALMVGGTTTVLVDDDAWDPKRLLSHIENQGITVFESVPAHFSILLDYIEAQAEKPSLSKLKMLMMNGEGLPPAYCERWFKFYPEIAMSNVYGPTECSDDITHYIFNEVSESWDGYVPIGKPIQNMEMYIVDEDMQLVPKGIIGELCTSGDGVGQGYLGRADLTNEKFIKNPFKANTKLYKTGDLVKWLEDGTIEFIGRKDSQVKISGNRIELGEIEVVLQEAPQVKLGAVLVKEDNTNKRLVGYIKTNESYTKEALHEYLEARLPAHMIPTLFIEMDKMPLTPSGKIDRKALPEPTFGEESKETYTAPNTTTEKQLITIWEELLNVSPIGIHDNFFKLGGHSLLAIRLVSHIQSAFEVTISIRDVFASPTIAALSTVISEGTQSAIPQIIVGKRPKYIPLSYAQERLWFIDKLQGSTAYHIPAVMRIPHEINIELLGKAMRKLVERHEALRTIFVEKDGIGYQEIISSEQFELNYISALPKNTSLETCIAQETSKAFDLSKDYMLRSTLIADTDGSHVLVLVVHHIASDGWSVPILAKELEALYEEFTTGKESNLPALPVQYADYSIWQRNYLSGETLDKKLAYWHNKLNGATPLELPTDFVRPAIQSMEGRVHNFVLNSELTTTLHQISKEQQATLFMTLISIYKVLLYRYTGQTDISIGTPIANREQQELEGLIGFFMNTIVLRDELESNADFNTLLAQVKETCLAAYEHQDVPFEQIVDNLNVERDQSRTPLFQTLFMLQNNEAVSEVSLGDAPVAEVATTHTTAKFDLTLNATETNGEILIQIEYATALFAEATITRMAKHFMLLTEAIAANTAQTISALPMIQEAEKQVLLEDFNQTEIAYASEKTVIDFFKAQVAKTPDATAICFEDQKLSYKELDEKSDALAQYLLSLGLAREELIPLCVDRSLEMMIAILGIQKAGAAYVPVDPNYPQDRIDFMLQDVKATKVVTTSNYATIFSASAEVSQIHVDNLPKREEQLEVSLNSQQLAYVFYTSGSTGTPKGVMIEHKALLNFLLSMSKTIDRESVKLLSVTAFTFDISILEFYYPLITGGQVYIANAIETTNPEALSQLINTFEPTCIQATPSRWQMIKDYGWTYNKDITLLSGGEPISKELTKYLIANATKVWNMYGPTETTIWSCEYQLINPDNISIGKPINNTQIYLLDDAHNLVPTGIAGELCIGGDGLARGYLNRSELTAEKFIPNPFRANKRIYKTGDLARWLPDGNLEFIGRKDDQVKLRGYRIELGEIEAVLDTIEAIQRAVVLVKKDTQGNAQLVGYITTTATIENKEIQEVLIEKLPEYMVPKLYMRLEEFPLTPNGKVNRKVLPLPDLTTQTVYVAPTTTTEKMLVTIWQELLQVSTIGIQHDFFELGGHSLLAIRLISQIQKQLQVTIDIRDVFAHSTIKSLATIIAESEVSSIPAIIPVKRPAQIPLSYAQERLWFIDQLQGSTAYHLSSILHVQGFDKTAFSKAVKALLDRHESLRTVFKEHDGIGYQSIMTSEAFTVNFVATLPQNETLENFIAYESNRPFDLSKEYMLRATLVQESDENQVLILVMHHIASDGWSIPILVKELELLYQGFVTGNEVELPALPIQYADYSIWQRNYLSGEILAKKLDYWTTKLQNTQALELPTDFVRPSIQSTEGKSYGFLLNKEIASGLNNISKAQNTTLFMTLLSIYKVLLYRYTGQTDISVGTPIANRHQEEVAGLIGFFMNTIVLRDELDAKASFAALLQQIKETCLEGYSHQDVPFEQIVDALSLERDRSTTPLFQTLFVLQNNESVDEVQVDNNSLQSRGNTSTTSKFDITTTMTETSEGIVVEFEYATALFKEETIVRMASHLEMLAKAVIENIQELIATLALLPTKETNTILNDFSTCEVSYDDSQTIVSLFETQVAKTPNARALVYQDLELNYSELDQKSNQVAHYLIEKGITKNTLVPLCMNPSLETIIALFGILKAGAAYVPIDPIFPTERIEYILKDCNADLLLSTTKTILPQTILEDISVIHLDEFAYEKYEVSKPAIDIFLDDLIYVIYTSGTTGNPKGVQIQHGALLDYVHGLCDKADLQACQSFALITSIAADVVNTALYPPFMLGGELHILPKETIMDAEAMSKVSVDCAKVVPSHWYSLQSEVYHFIPKKCILFGGEALKEEMLAFLRSQNFQGDVYNHYGPTETTVGKLINKINLETSLDKIPLGKPFGNTQIFILDENDQLCPIGIHGELCIAGAGLAKGYVNQPTLTEEKFITTNINNTITRIYKTGDVARWLPSGEVEFLGRKDHQIKIRGYRVELNEIASILEESKEIKQAIVTAIEDTSGSKQLVGYVVLDTEISSEEMQRRLQEKLPEYMIPKSFMRLEAFPLTSNGKINRKQLPTQTLVQQRSDYVAPRTAVEAKLVSIWEALLNVAKIGIHDNFFELGGDSIKAIQLVSRSKFAGLNYMVKDIFAYQTIAEIAQHIKNNTGNILVEKGVLEGNVSLHPIQKDFFERNYAVPNHYNQSVLLTIEKSIDKTTLEEAIRVLTLQHDALRLQFTETENTYPTQTYTVQHARLHVETIVSTEEIHAVCSQHQASLEISNADITRFVLLETPENEAQNRLLIAVHHLAIDGISWRILLEDFMMLVEKIQGKQSYTLPEKATSYRQWTEKLAAYANSEALAAEYEFWKETVASYTEIPSNSSETTTSEAQQYAVQLSKEQTELLVRDVNSTYQTEINDILLSALAMSFKNWHQAEQLMIHLEGHGREELFDDVDIYRTIGWFTTLYPVSLKIPQTNNLESHIINTKNSLRAIPNKGIGYSILRHLATSEVIQKTLKIPQKDIVFNYLGSFDNTTGNSDRQDNQQLIGFASESKGLESALENQSPYKLAINGMISDGQLQFEWQYNTKDFTKETIATLSEAFITALEAIISHCTSVEGESVKNNEQHLILFQSEGNGVPLYLIPPLGGTSSVLEEFASYLGNDRPIYGIEMEGLFEGETPFTTIKEIAAHNIKRIKAAQPNGPYVFMGYSFGGSVAYEMAKQFEEANEEALPILLDQPAFFEDSERDSAEEIAKRAVEGISESITEAGQDHKLAENWETALAQDLDITNVEAAWQTVIDFLRANKIEFTNDIEVLGRVFKLFLTNTNLSYLTEGKLQKMLLVRSERDPKEFTDHLGWEHFVDTIHLVQATGNHHTLIREENGKQLANVLREKIQKLTNEHTNKQTNE